MISCSVPLIDSDQQDEQHLEGIAQALTAAQDPNRSTAEREIYRQEVIDRIKAYVDAKTADGWCMESALGQWWSYLNP
jgi:hypothetical protein